MVLIGCVAGVLAACGRTTARPAPATPPIENIPGPEPAPDSSAHHPSCTDPIAGTWRARVWRAEVAKVDEVTLTLSRIGLTELRGEITVETWDAAGRDDEPALCPDGSPAVSRVLQLASGWVHGAEVDIEGSDPERTAFACGIETTAGYNPDHFTGELDEESTLVTTNDDGALDQGRLHVFTRVACAR